MMIHHATFYFTFLWFILAFKTSDSLSILSSYHVTTSVQGRMADTMLEMLFQNVNGTNCSLLHTLTLQLPRNARVKSLEMDLSDGCQLTSDIQALEQAQDTFDSQASEGKPAALLTAWDMSNYGLQVSIPPLNGTSKVTLRYSELLVQKQHRVAFQVPVFPGTDVDHLEMDVEVTDEHSGIVKFGLDHQEMTTDDLNIMTVSDHQSKLHYHADSVLAGSTALPRLVQAFYQPGPMPDRGLFLASSEASCFTHMFNLPADFMESVGSMAKRINFVVDVSGSMGGKPLEDAKVAFAAMVDTLTERDVFSVQTFSDSGSEALWGPATATATSKEDAIRWVQSLDTVGGTNLHGAYMDGIDHVRTAFGTNAEQRSSSNMAKILMVLSDGQASAGVTGRRKIAHDVRQANADRQVKIYSLALGSGADLDLLTGIAIQNGGRAIPIYQGFGDAASQMRNFYAQELEKIWLSDIGITYNLPEGVELVDSTQSSFPVLADGSELVVRGRLNTMPIDSSTSWQAVVSAQTAAGAQQWSNDFAIAPPPTTALLNDTLTNSSSSATTTQFDDECIQAFAQARIAELLQYRNAARALGNESLLVENSRRQLSALSFEEQAREIAIRAQLVWPGLTALVTVENPSCQSESHDVCYTGEGGTIGAGDEVGDGIQYSGGYSSGSSLYEGCSWICVSVMMCLMVVNWIMG